MLFFLQIPGCDLYHSNLAAQQVFFDADPDPRWGIP